MTEQPKSDEVEKMLSIVDAWVNDLSEHHVAKELDRVVLHGALEACGANFDIDEKHKGRLGRNHHSSSIRREAVKVIWGDIRYDELVEFSKQYVASLESSGVEVPSLAKSGKNYLGLTGFIEEITAYAATDDETYSPQDFFVRMTTRALNGYVTYELGSKKKEHRVHMMISGYNNIVYEFDGQEGDIRESEMPFAPPGFPPQFPKDAWDYIKSRRG